MNDHPPAANPRKDFLLGDSPQALFAVNIGMAFSYLCILLFLFPRGDTVLFTLLVVGEVFHLWQVITFLYTVWNLQHEALWNGAHAPGVDVFITVAGEPVELVEETARAAQAMDYPDFAVHILNDGYVAKKDNWREIEALAARLGVRCITRTVPGGAKAGNINNALRLTEKPLVAIFDADHVPHADFLRKTAAYFIDPKMGFVQTPQYYKNREVNYLAESSWEQQELFFGAICQGKNRLNAATMCGTNMLISRDALAEVGGMCTESIAEDFVTGMFIHEKGYKSLYVPEVLAEGLATEDLLTYQKQQFRWARGALDVIFRYNPLWRRGLSFAQRIQYLASASFYFSGVVVLLDALLPLVFFYTGLVPVKVSGMFLALVFLPYLFLTLYNVQRATNYTFTFPSLAFSMGAFHIHLQALWAALSGQRSAFVVSEKRAREGNYLSLLWPHFLYMGLCALGVLVAYAREGLSASLINNIAWAGLTLVVFVPFIRAALPARRPAARAAGPAGALPELSYGKAHAS